MRNRRKMRQGVVVSNKMDKTAVVKVTRKVRHPLYGKLVERWKRYYVHDQNNDLEIGQHVKIMETRPISKLKRWRAIEKIDPKAGKQ